MFGGHIYDESSTSFEYDDNATENVGTGEFKNRRLVGPIGVAVLSIVGLIGNLSIMYLVLRHKNLRNAPNILIINLTMGDLLYIVCTVPFFIEKEISGSFESSVAACKVKAYFEDVGQGLCVFSLAALSRERYLAIVRGIETRRRRGSCYANSLFAVAVVVAAALLLGIPSAVFAHKPNDRQCDHLPRHHPARNIFVTTRTFLGYLLPLCIVAFYYVRIALSLYRSLQQFGDSGSHAQQSRLRKRLAGIVLFITVMFAIFWLPHFVHLHWRAYAPIDVIAVVTYPSAIDTLRIISFLMALTNSCSNPWIVFAMSSKHRQHCYLFGTVCRKQQFRRGQGTTRLTTLTAVGTVRRTSGNMSQMSHV